MEKFKTWEVFLAGLVFPLLLFIAGRLATRRKYNADLFNAALDAKAKIDALVDKKTKELQQEAEHLKNEMRTLIRRYQENMSKCLQQVQDMQRENIKLMSEIKILRSQIHPNDERQD